MCSHKPQSINRRLIIRSFVCVWLLQTISDCNLVKCKREHISAFTQIVGAQTQNKWRVETVNTFFWIIIISAVANHSLWFKPSANTKTKTKKQKKTKIMSYAKFWFVFRCTTVLSNWEQNCSAAHTTNNRHTCALINRCVQFRTELVWDVRWDLLCVRVSLRTQMWFASSNELQFTQMKHLFHRNCCAAHVPIGQWSATKLMTTTQSIVISRERPMSK